MTFATSFFRYLTAIFAPNPEVGLHARAVIFPRETLRYQVFARGGELYGLRIRPNGAYPMSATVLNPLGATIVQGQSPLRFRADQTGTYTVEILNLEEEFSVDFDAWVEPFGNLSHQSDTTEE